MPAKLDRCVQQVMGRADMRSKYPDEAERRSHAFAICNAALKMGGEGVEEYGYVTKLSEDAPSRVHALRVGKYEHPAYGTIDITPERLQRFAASVNEKTRGIDAGIDYAHKSDGKAAGWIKAATVDGNDLFVDVEWTDEAREAIKGKQYRYFSSEIMDKWKDAEGNEHADVFIGGGLTNRPFMKNLAPLNFSEFYDDVDANNDIDVPVPNDNPEGGNELDAKQFAEVLGITTDDEATILAEVKSLHEFRAAKLTEAEKAQAFAERYPEEAKRLQELENTNKLMETDNRVSEWMNKGLPPVLFEDEGENKSLGLREFRMSLTKDQAAKFDELVAKVIETGVARFEGEQGGNADPTSNADVGAKFESLIKKFQDEDKLGYLDAVKAAENAEPELAKAYNTAVREGVI